MVELKVLITGALSNNVYLVTEKDRNESVIFDPSFGPEGIIEMIESSGTTLKGIIITHGHFDHLMSVPVIKEKYNIPVYCSRVEKDFLEDGDMNGSVKIARKKTEILPDILVDDGQVIEVAGMKFEMILTPGHSKGSACWYMKEENVLFSGDTLFYGSYGRTDFETGNEEELIDSINNKLFVLPEDTDVFPGHGEATTIGFEKKYNPIKRLD